MKPPVQGMNIGQQFEAAVRLIGATLKRNLLILLVVFVPGMLPLFASVFSAMNTLGRWVGDNSGSDPVLPDFGQFLPLLLFFCLGLLVMGLTSVLAQSAMMVTNASEMEGEELTWTDALKLASGMRLLRMLGAYLLMGGAFAALFLVPVSLFFIPQQVTMFAGVLLLLAALPAIAWLSIRWAFVQIIVPWEGDEVMHSFARSGFLVSDNWWRTFGMMLLFGLAAGTVTSIAVMPVTMILMFGNMASILPDLNGPMQPDMMLRMFRGMAVGYSVSILLNAALQMIMQASYMVVLYFDLRARKGEFKTPEMQAGGPAPLDIPYPLV
jgi:hypothetical protein